jgi:hypothetical protein
MKPKNKPIVGWRNPNGRHRHSKTRPHVARQGRIQPESGGRDRRSNQINAALGEDVATKPDIALLDSKIKLVDGKITLSIWAVGINLAATITKLVKHL